MSQRELQRLRLIGLVEAGTITLKDASEKMGVSYRQGKRIFKSYKDHGESGLAHGNRGRPAFNRTSADVRLKVLEFSEKYREFNDSHFTEKLLEVEGISISRETVRRLRRTSGTPPKRKRRAPKHRSRRERMPQEGLMALWDGSPHRWFGPGEPPCCLMAAIDDASGKFVAGRFFPFEGSHGYLWLLDRMVRDNGIPAAIYQDRHGSLKRNDDHWSLEEELAGRQEPTQVGVALDALGIKPIFARSPQGKGRVERLFGTLQDRLGAELSLAGIKTIEAANTFLEMFIVDFNRRFSVSTTGKAWREVPEDIDIDRVISFRYAATVANDNTVKVGGTTIQIPPGPKGRSYAKAKVEVRRLLNGSWRVYYGDRFIAKLESTASDETIRAIPRKRKHLKGDAHNEPRRLAAAPT